MSMIASTRRVTFVAGAVILLLAALPGSVAANHSWGNYHWARESNPFTLRLGDNVSSSWDSYLATTSSDWSASSVLDTTVVAGRTRAKTCRATTGQVEVCSAAYGNNGWLGLAQIWLGGSHITKGTVKVNDSYFKSSPYNSPAWRNLVMCQEVGHTLGLDHQDEDFDNGNLGTCMDYTSSPEANQHPNQHDYDQLETIYAHLDSTTTVASSAGGAKPGKGHANRGWGRLIATAHGGRAAVYELRTSARDAIVTFVIWA